jgi:hypothetical protein
MLLLPVWSVSTGTLKSIVDAAPVYEAPVTGAGAGRSDTMQTWMKMATTA